MKGVQLLDGRERLVRHGPVEVQRVKLRDRGADAGRWRACPLHFDRTVAVPDQADA